MSTTEGEMSPPATKPKPPIIAVEDTDSSAGKERKGGGPAGDGSALPPGRTAPGQDGGDDEDDDEEEEIGDRLYFHAFTKESYVSLLAREAEWKEREEQRAQPQEVSLVGARGGN